MNNTTIKIEADGDFPFSFYIEKAIPEGTEEEMSIKGVASTVNVDHDGERMAESSLHAMADIINEKSVPLRVEHQKDNNAIVGNVNKAWVDSRNQLWIEAALDKSHPGASMLYKALKTGAKLGLSVGGRVKHAVREFSEAAGKMVKTFYNVVLDEVSVTSRPANYDAWLVSKSIIDKEEDGAKFVESPFYKEFIFESEGYDYIQSFAKSIPNKAWKRVDINKNNEEKSMKDEKEVKKDSSETSEETKEKTAKKEETETEDTAFKSMVMKGFESLTAMLAKLTKAAEHGTSETEETTIMETKTKNTAETSETETKEKKESTTEDTKETEAATKDYQIKSMQNLLKKMEDLAKTIDDTKETDDTTEETKTKTTATETETTEKSQDLDKFVDAIAKSIDNLTEKIEKGGKRTLGLTEMIVNAIRNDAAIQEEIKGMMKEPGFKKSMQFGVPMMRTKDGKAFRLVAALDDDAVEKSKKDNAGKTFKEVYNKNFSSSAGAEE